MNRRTQRDLRAIDYKIARELMRQELVDVPFIPVEISLERDTFTDEAAAQIIKSYAGRCLAPKRCPEYSIDPRLAVEILNALVLQRWSVKISPFRRHESQLWWVMSATRRGKEVTSCEGSFPQAVSLLALGTLR